MRGALGLMATLLLCGACVRTTLQPIACQQGGADHPLCPPTVGDGAVDDAGGGDSDAGCAQLVASGPINVTQNGQVIENLRVTSSSTDAVVVRGIADVVIRNCEIRHAGGSGIVFEDATNLRIEDTVIVHTGAPAQGANPSTGLTNITGEYSTGVVIRSVRLTGGSDGINLLDCPGAQLLEIEVHDVRGPSPDGQCIKLNRSHGATLSDFSCENPVQTSWPQHGVLVHQSSDVTVQRGLLDGNTDPFGIGVLFEQIQGQHSGGLCEDVDAVRMGNGCYGAQPGFGITFRRTRARDNICTDQGRGAPASGGLAWSALGTVSGLRIEQSSHFNLCYDSVWDPDNFDALDLQEADFTPREPLRLSFCWE